MMFEVEVKCGHVGKNHYILKKVPVMAESRKAAAALARLMPRVKHDHPDAIRRVRVIDAPRFVELVKVHQADPYFQCQSIQEQRKRCGSLDIIREERQRYPSKLQKTQPCKLHHVGKEIIRNPKRYQKYYITSEDIAA